MSLLSVDTQIHREVIGVGKQQIVSQGMLLACSLYFPVWCYSDYMPSVHLAVFALEAQQKKV